ncbi:patched domain-containing protein 3 isoform X2 [Anabrus simplex]|uniref:patched domain-containing protein 3 isoform X2 n=1 Tax=Anabrus simplex TaxID=316456 RepID=UPI0034DD4FF4
MEQNNVKRSSCRYISSAIVGSIENLFYRYGYAIGCHPWRFIIGCLSIVILSSLGILRFHQEKHPMRLWIPPGSDFARDTEWLMKQFREGIRVQSILVTAPDVLQPEVLQQLAKIHHQVTKLASPSGIAWEDVCFRIPVISFNVRKKRETTEDGSVFDDLPFGFEEETDDNSWKNFDPSIVLPLGMYCAIVNSLETACLERSLLELWKYDTDELESVTPQRIREDLNKTISPVLGHPVNFTHLLGGIKRNEAGEIVSAASLLSQYMIHVNFSAVNLDETGNGAGTADWATAPVLEWEKQFLQFMSHASKDVEGMQVYYEAGRSYGDISEAAIFQDIDKLIIGIALMFIYVQVILSKFNMVEFRFILANVGLLCIGMAFVVACGICSVLGISYGPVHTALPFLLMGIGVDDMFVIMACWNNLTPAERQMSIPEKMGRTLQHAGTSITITSLTDVIAFMVGATTILPSLQSFCLYAAVGVLVTYVFQATFFVAVFVLDERRVQNSRNGLLFCIKHHDYKPNTCSQMDLSKRIFHILYNYVILTIPGQVFIVLLTAGFAAISIKGNMDLRQKFDPVWFLPERTHLYQFIKEQSTYYPDMGQHAGVFFGSLNYSAEIPKIKQLAEQLRKESDILKDVEDWYDGFENYVNVNFGYNLPHDTLSDDEFSNLLSRYLFSPSGASYQKNFRFDGNLSCGIPAPPVTVSSFDFKFKLFHGPEESLPAMNRVKKLVREANFTTGDQFATVWGKIFANWVTDEVNVAGMMYFWGLTIDIVSCIGLELAAGLCVDYAAHIGHTFLTCSGTRKERALKTVEDIGPAIMSGGTATLLALVVLANSESYIFVSFFKIFLLVVCFGLFHGVVFLPVILSVIGPAPYQKLCNADVQLQSNKLYDLCDMGKDEERKMSSQEEPS